MSKTKKIILTILGIGIVSAAGIGMFNNGDVEPILKEPILESEVLETTSINTDKGKIFTERILYRGVEVSVSTDLVGYNQCKSGQFGTTTDAFCLEKLKEQMKLNRKWAEEAIDGQKAEKDLIDYSDAIVLENL